MNRSNGNNPYGQNPYGQNPYPQNPYPQNPYGVNPYPDGVSGPPVAMPNPADDPYGHRYYPAAMPYQGEAALLPTNPRIKPQTAMVARERGYDPTVVNAPLMRRCSALLIDISLYVALITALAVVAAIVGADSGTVIGIAAILGPAGFYGFRAAGDAIFEGSLGKHALGLGMVGANGLPVSATDGLRRNAWILPSMIPVAGWFASAGLLAWFAVSASSDPLGQGAHERGVGTRVIEKPEPKKTPKPKQISKTKGDSKSKKSSKSQKA